MLEYLISLPERTVRASAATGGGLTYELAQLLLPTAVRRSTFYRTAVEGLLRIVVESVGGVEGVFPANQVGGQELVTRKAAGNALELASLAAVGWSPLWLLAAVSDLTAGTRVYLHTLVEQLKRDNVLAEDAEIDSAEQLLHALEKISTTAASTVDIPPLDVAGMRASWQTLRQNVAELPDAPALAYLFDDLQDAAQQSGLSVQATSGALAASALRAGIELSNTHIFNYYRDTLKMLRAENPVRQATRTASPYFKVGMGHFSPKHSTITNRLLARFRPPAVPESEEPPRASPPQPE